MYVFYETRFQQFSLQLLKISVIVYDESFEGKSLQKLGITNIPNNNNNKHNIFSKHTHTHTHIYIHTHTHIYIYTHTYIYIYTHTHTHTHRGRLKYIHTQKYTISA
jgi:hypothetical protein